MTRRRGRHLEDRPRRIRLPRSTARQLQLVLAFVGTLGTLLALVPEYFDWPARRTVEPQAVSASTTSASTIPVPSTTEKATTTSRSTTTTMAAAAAADSVWASVEVNPEKTTMFSTANDQHQGFVVPAGTRIIGGPPGTGCGQFYPWLAERGGVPAENTYLRLVLQGKAANAVLLSSMRARIVERRARLAGTPLWCGAGGAGVDIRFVYLDLDKSPAVGVHGEFSDTKGLVHRKPFGFTLKRNETEVFEIWATTRTCYCKWVIELDLVVNGTQAVKTITNRGRPFQTTAWSCCRSYVWMAGAWYLDAGGEPQPRDKPLKPLA